MEDKDEKIRLRNRKIAVIREKEKKTKKGREEKLGQQNKQRKNRKTTRARVIEKG